MSRGTTLRWDVDVKPHRRLADPKVAFILAWSKTAVESRGWAYEIWSEPSQPELDNVRFLAGYRRHRLFDRKILDELRMLDWAGVSLGEAERIPFPVGGAGSASHSPSALAWRPEHRPHRSA